jgi:hypothetical protein
VDRSRRLWWTLDLLMATALLGVLVGYHHVGYYQCNACGSAMVRHEWGVGDPGGFGLPILPIHASEIPSRAREMLFDDGHRHDWAGWFGWVRSTFWAVHWDGHPRYNSFGRLYEDDPQFRAFIHGRLRAGSLTREEAAALVALRRPLRPPSFCPAHPPGEPLPKPTPDPEHTALVQLGERLFEQYHAHPPADTWWYWH